MNRFVLEGSQIYALEIVSLSKTTSFTNLEGVCGNMLFIC
jgi:hypothetical protein